MLQNRCLPQKDDRHADRTQGGLRSGRGSFSLPQHLFQDEEVKSHPCMEGDNRANVVSTCRHSCEADRLTKGCGCGQACTGTCKRRHRQSKVELVMIALPVTTNSALLVRQSSHATTDSSHRLISPRPWPDECLECGSGVQLDYFRNKTSECKQDADCARKRLGECSLRTRESVGGQTAQIPWHDSGESTTLSPAWTLEIAMTTCQHLNACCCSGSGSGSTAVTLPMSLSGGCGDAMLRERWDMTPYSSRKKGSAVRLCTYFGNVTPVHC